MYKPGVRVIYLKEVFDRDFMYESDGYALINGCSGRITTHSSVRFLLSCSFDFREYPFDQQRCELTFYAPTYDEYAKEDDVSITVVVAAVVVVTVIVWPTVVVLVLPLLLFLLLLLHLSLR